jgi:hypothetical protein
MHCPITWAGEEVLIPGPGNADNRSSEAERFANSL